MCELFCFSGHDKRNLNPELNIFYSHSETNPNGWGIYYQLDEGTFFKKGPEKANLSEELKIILESPVDTQYALAHIRHATIGANAYLNSHPFKARDNMGKEWVFMHNGSIFEGHILDAYKDVQEGQTDSERIFLYIMDRINQAFSQNNGITEEEQFHILEDIVEELSPENKLNLIFTNGEYTAIHTNMENTLYEKKITEGTLFATVPLDDFGWVNLPLNTLVVYKKGKRVYTGKRHEHLYIEDKARLQALLDKLEEK